MDRQRHTMGFDSACEYNKNTSISAAQYTIKRKESKRDLHRSRRKRGYDKEVAMLRHKANKEENADKKVITIAILAILFRFAGLVMLLLVLFAGGRKGGIIGVITTTGEVKVDIVDASNEQISLVGEALQFRGPTGLGEILFEPGMTLFTQGFKVKNTGEVPINYHVVINTDDKIDMEEFREAFDVWISTNVTGADACPLTGFKGYLKEGESSEDTYYLFVRMKTTAGNEFQGKSYTGIGITVYAVQGSKEIKE